MIIKGKSRSGPGALAAHLGNAEKNERVQLLEMRGTVASDLRGALIEMDALAAGTRCARPLYHAALSPEPPHRLSDQQRTESVDALEKKLGLEGHARVVVLHEKLGREHLHVVWTRIDLREMRAVHDGHNYRKHEEVARDLERRFGHARVQGAHHERENVERPFRTPSRAELRQEERTGVTGKQVREQVTAAFRTSDGPEAFRAALAEKGYQLATGDRRDFVIIDRAGGVHSLARRIEGVRAAELREYMAPLDRTSVPAVEEARTAAMERASEARARQDETVLEKVYGRGDDYVSQSRAALIEHQRRQNALDQRNDRDAVWDRIEAGEARREKAPGELSHGASTDESRDVLTEESERRRREDDREPAGGAEAADADVDLGDMEMSEAQRERIDRILGQNGPSRTSSRDGPSRQHGAPGGGRTRSR